jgi:membrane associated rhomboid family serine protease
MLFPLRTDRRLTRTPWVNLALITLCGIVWLLELTGSLRGQHWIGQLTLNPRNPAWFQFITYQFLHQSWEHIALNMLFLYVFGNSLEDRLGHFAYLCFFLAGGVVAGIGHCLASDAPVLGASGAVSAITGGYLALFPRSNVTVIWFLLIIDTFEVPGIALIGMQIGLDFAFQLFTHYYPDRFPMAQVAYVAHLSGNLFGFLVGLALLATHVLPRERFDILSLIHDARRASRQPQRSDQIDADAVLRAMNDRRVADALDAYESLLATQLHHVLPKQAQLDIAAWAMESGRFVTAARAYEIFLQHYHADEFADQVQLILGMIYGRHLNDAERAKPLLRAAAGNLSDPQRKKIADDLLVELGG